MNQSTSSHGVKLAGGSTTASLAQTDFFDRTFKWTRSLWKKTANGHEQTSELARRV
jgi:hypothetical protein